MTFPTTVINPPPSPNGSLGSTGIPFLTPVPPAIGGQPAFGIFGNISVTINVSLSSPNGIANWGQTDTISVPVVCYWNNENCYSGVTFYGWQAQVTYDTEVPGEIGIPNVKVGVAPGHVLGNADSPNLGVYLQSGNNIARNNWDYQNPVGAAPPTGYVPIFSDLPDVRQLMIGVNIQTWPTGLASPLAIRQWPGGNGLGSYGFEPLPTAPGPFSPTLHWTLTDRYNQITVSVAEFPDMTQMLGNFGKSLAQSPPIIPSTMLLDTAHMGTFTPFPSGGANAYLPQWDTDWIDALTKPFVVVTGQASNVGQVYTGLPYGYVPNGYFNPDSFTIDFKNSVWAVHGGYLMNFQPYGMGVNYWIPNGIGFSDHTVQQIAVNGAFQQYYVNATTAVPNAASTFGPYTLTPPGVVYGQPLLGPPFDSGPASPAYTAFIANGYGPTSTYVSPSTGDLKTIIFMDVPMTGSKNYHLYTSTSNLTQADPYTQNWTLS